MYTVDAAKPANAAPNVLSLLNVSMCECSWVESAGAGDACGRAEAQESVKTVGASIRVS